MATAQIVAPIQLSTLYLKCHEYGPQGAKSGGSSDSSEGLIARGPIVKQGLEGMQWTRHLAIEGMRVGS